MEIGAGVWISVIIICGLVVWLTIWVTNKAYSKKWEKDEDPRQK